MELGEEGGVIIKSTWGAIGTLFLLICCGLFEYLILVPLQIILLTTVVGIMGIVWLLRKGRRRIIRKVKK